MTSRAIPQDSFIEEEEETCPLCIEELDLSDKGFKPCPCGFQICQFCFNVIRNTGNNLCPACRREYNEKSIQWKVVSPEELKAESQKQSRKKEELKRKEAQKREFETLNRKHLAGLRVVQKNLVYVVGLNPHIREDELHSTLRGDQYFGQYGKIIKIVVAKPKEGSRNDQSLGVYVTFERKEDALNCIRAVDGSKNGDRVLKAQFGTTKYCSAYLRNENCPNKSCMFLHEAGEDKDSFTREDLSSKNVESSQTSAAPAAAGYSRPPQTHPIPPKPPQPVATVGMPTARRPSRDGSGIATDDDGSALPSSASWANKNSISHSTPSTNTSQLSTINPAVPTNRSQSALDLPSEPLPVPRSKHHLDSCLVSLEKGDGKYLFDFSLFSEQDAKVIKEYPSLLAPDGGSRLLAARAKEAEQLAEAEELAKAISQEVLDEKLASGSLQLGGEPEPPSHDREAQDPRRLLPSTSAPIGANFNQPLSSLTNLSNLSINGRGLTPIQQQHLLQLKSGNSQGSVLDQLSAGLGSQYGQNSQSYGSGFQGQSHAHHGRGLSRYSFANDSASSTTTVKPAANPKVMAQQASMMPTNATPGLSLHGSNQGFSSGMSGPPPGLKAAGTPPISGGGMFGQGHGFTSNMPRTVNASDKDSQPDMLRDLFRGRGGSNTGGLGQAESGKREFNFPPFDAPLASPVSAQSFGMDPGALAGPFQHLGAIKRKHRGKKHRHANTSSFGGSGIVDLADPTILQARMQQQQGSASSGQAMYGGQGQPGGYNTTPYGNPFNSRW
ncbi:MAG: transcriptional repressor general negative regulator of transcription subunit 4 [Vezdaea aestivalis]|nr:MAG: transcriptional repressor general negative regulator of transcription subunit 4 [Vezdaea aestivalis]